MHYTGDNCHCFVLYQFWSIEIIARTDLINYSASGAKFKQPLDYINVLTTLLATLTFNEIVKVAVVDAMIFNHIPGLRDGHGLEGTSKDYS